MTHLDDTIIQTIYSMNSLFSREFEQLIQQSSWADCHHQLEFTTDNLPSKRALHLEYGSWPNLHLEGNSLLSWEGFLNPRALSLSLTTSPWHGLQSYIREDARILPLNVTKHDSKKKILVWGFEVAQEIRPLEISLIKKCCYIDNMLLFQPCLQFSTKKVWL